ncbi:lytic polysaccharide monooxygenase [Myceligenerans crystallogenes]|uniref:CBM2 domain-containing protein n=1 Tax=Myceligenerans crystallogenes TaxID=316335 RepID=A0ABN2NAN6_9MICO
MHVVTAARARTAAVLAAVALVLSMGVVAIQTANAPDAAAHGSVTNPPSRNYGCHSRTGADFDDPAMATYDPMCYQAWQANPDAMWNWNGLYQNGMGGNYSSVGSRVCSGGGAEGGKYAALDKPGRWVAKGVPTSFQLRLDDQANHGADYLRVYVTRAGFDPTTQQVSWSDLQLVKETGRFPTQSPYTTDVNLSGRSGRAVLFTLWKASHQDQTYFICSDINIGGGDLGPWPSSNPGTPSTTPPPSSTTPPPASGGACTAAVTVTNSWSGGYQANLNVTAGSSAISGWRVSLAGATVTQAWNGTLSGSNVISDAGWNGSLAAGASTSAGFVGSGSASGVTATCTAE